jgi:ferrous iron transport protein B
MPAFNQSVSGPLKKAPIFLVIMWLIFQTTFTWIGTPLSDQLDAFFSGPLTESIELI